MKRKTQGFLEKGQRAAPENTKRLICQQLLTTVVNYEGDGERGAHEALPISGRKFRLGAGSCHLSPSAGPATWCWCPKLRTTRGKFPE